MAESTVAPGTALRPALGTVPGTGLGEVLTLFRTGEELTRSEVMDRTGLSRSTVNGRLDALLSAGLLVQSAEGAPTRGRPAGRFAFHSERGVLLVADMGATAVRVGLCDLRGDVQAQTSVPIEITDGPQVLLGTVTDLIDGLLEDAGRPASDVLGIGLSVPGPVDFARGQVVSPPIMPGWDGFDIAGWFAGRGFRSPVVVDKDVNAMALGEQRTRHPDVTHLLMLKLGTGVGASVVAEGKVYRGADGAAGDVGHSQLTAAGDAEPPLCRCGNVGCLEAYVGGWALLRDLQAAGKPVRTVDEVVELVLAGDPAGVQLVRQAGRTLGAAIADAVSLFNPRIVVIGGQLARLETLLFAGIREMVYKRSLPLATRQLRIERSELDTGAGLVGLALLLSESIFAPDRVQAMVGRS
ncbi:ROK family protein [Spongisporangium articulatum]|uniref:ROK family protein n=1 Tax=Spongisporangium articulatum TaxID=3362603 RepID=A0ABW8AJJ3_9ACTN